MGNFILHSGEFTDRFDNNYRVTFYTGESPVPPPPYVGGPLKFTAHNGVAVIDFWDRAGSNPNIEYSYDCQTWETWDYSEISLTDGQSVYMRGYNPDGFNKSKYYECCFEILNAKTTGTVSCEGNIMSLIDRTGETKVIPNDYCFSRIFHSCKKLTSAPAFPATTLTVGCYQTAFIFCTALTQSPELPATTLAEGCYGGMFQGCSSLVNAPELPAMTLADSCYELMFLGCSSLVNAPELPATTLADGCYNRMFEDCSSLVNAPELPATTLAELCYERMFNGCTALVNAPELPATTLANSCYYQMFGGCSSLNYVKCYAVDNISGNCTFWLSNVSPTGTFYQNRDATWTTGSSGIPSGWTVVNIHPARIKFVSIGNNVISLANYDNNQPNIEISYDDQTWTTWDYSNISLANNQSVYMKGYNPIGFSQSPTKYSHFVISGDGNVACEGNIMALIDGVREVSAIPNSYCFVNLFAGCSSLTQAPELPATTLETFCYMNMFFGCSNLNSITCLAVNRAYNDTYNWTTNVSSTGTFYKDPSTTWATGNSGVPSGWTIVDVE